MKKKIVPFFILACFVMGLSSCYMYGPGRHREGHRSEHRGEHHEQHNEEHSEHHRAD